MAKPISKEVRDRIFRAADELYEEGGRESFPRVHDVRERAGANMNDIGPCMREWRKLKTAQATPVTIQVQQASRAALALAGGGFATESLRVAQAGWEAEQVEAQELAQQMADAFDTQATELEAARQELAKLSDQIHAEREQANAQINELKKEAELVEKKIQEQATVVMKITGEAAAANARVEELRAELERERRERADARGKAGKQQ